MGCAGVIHGFPKSPADRLDLRGEFHRFHDDSMTIPLIKPD